MQVTFIKLLLRPQKIYNTTSRSKYIFSNFLVTSSIYTHLPPLH